MSTQEKEITEAINAANDALYYLSIADEKLSAARGWGIADLLGGKMLTTMIKLSRMSEAAEAMRAAAGALEVLNRELDGVDGYEDLDVNLDSYMGFADYFFDNTLIDLMTQSRISSASDAVRSIISEVEGILDALSDLSAENR